MSEDPGNVSDKGSHIPTEGVIGIVAGGVVLVVIIIIFVYCKLYRKQRRRLGNKHVVPRRGNTVKTTGIFSRSWRKSDEETTPVRVHSGSSFDTGVRTSDQITSSAYDSSWNRISYDRPYTTDMTNYAYSDPTPAEPVSMRREPRRLPPAVQPTVVSNYGEVRVKSPGVWTDSTDSNRVPNGLSDSKGPTLYENWLEKSNSKTELIRQSNAEASPRVSQIYVPQQDSGQSRPESGQSRPGSGPSHYRHSTALYAISTKSASGRSFVRELPVTHQQRHSSNRQSSALYVNSNPELGNFAQDQEVLGESPDGRKVIVRRHSERKSGRLDSGQYDSFRQSNAVDLGAEPGKAWMVSGYGTTGSHPCHDFSL